MKYEDKLFSAGLGLRFYFFLFTILPLGLVFLVASLFGVRKLEQQLTRAMQEDVELVARALKKPISRALREGDASNVREMITAVLDINRLYGVYVYDSDGNPTVFSGPDVPAEHPPKLKKKDPQGEYTQFEKRQVYSYYVPLTHKGLAESLGLLQVVRKKSDIDGNIARFRTIAVVWILGLFIFIFGMFILFHQRWVLRPLNKLAHGFEEIGQGNVNVNLEPQGTYEFRYLLDSFQTMAHNLKLSRKQNEKKQLEKINLEKQLQRSEKLAAVGELAAGVAHELGTPLSVIDAQVQQGLRGSLSQDRTQTLLVSLQEETNKMTQVVRDLLNFSHPEQSHELESVNLSQVIEQVKTTLSQFKPNFQGIIHIDSASPTDLCVRASFFRLEQAFRNILKNAIETTLENNNHLVKVSWKASGDMAICSIQDKGVGIPAGEHSKVFDPFYTTKRPGKGTGLGLSIVHSIVSDMGGTIEFDGNTSDGALCILKLPVG